MQEDQTFQNFKDNSEQVDSSHSEQQIKLKQARDHISNYRHTEIVRNDNYRKCIPLRERLGNWFSSTFAKCSSSQRSHVQILDQKQTKHQITLSEDYKKLFSDKIMKIKIIETSRLQLDSNVIHPFVKVHIVNINTGCYLLKDFDQRDPMTYHHESITFFDKAQRRFDSSQNNLLLPFATTMCDFRQIGNSIGNWNEQFYINFPAQRIMRPQTVILFQILDFNHQALLYRDTNIYDKDNFYRVAWAYLRPVGMGSTHIGKSKLQLYRYKFNNKKSQAQLNKPNIPSVYYDFIWNNHEKYEGFLSVQLNEVSAPKYRFIDEQTEYPTHLFEDERPDLTFLRRLPGKGQVLEDQQNKINEHLLKFYRNRNICEIPQQMIYKVESQKLGCYRTLFVSNYLFAACPSKKYTNIKVYSLENGEKKMTLKGHRQIIHSLTTTQNQKFLISAGSDHITRVWQIPQNFGQYIDEEESEHYLRASCVHSAAIYSTACIHVPLSDRLYLVTCCFDGFLRLWQINLKQREEDLIKEILINNYERSPNKVYPTYCVASQSNFFIVGDSIGDIRIYDFARQTLNLRCSIMSEQLKNDLILNIKILNKNNIIIQASDNLLRHFELTTNKLRLVQKFSGAQFQNKLMDCAVSPDNQYLLSPSENGKPYMWDLRSGLSINVDHLNLQIKGPLVTCSWHPKYNLVAFGGFVELCPILVYGNVLSAAEQKLVAASYSK